MKEESDITLFLDQVLAKPKADMQPVMTPDERSVPKRSYDSMALFDVGRGDGGSLGRVLADIAQSQAKNGKELNYKNGQS